MENITVGGLNIFPIKGCAGIAVDTCEVKRDGIVHDHVYAVVDYHTGRFISQRDHPELTLVSTSIRGKWLGLEHPLMAIMHVDLSLLDSTSAKNVRDITIHDDPCRGIVVGQMSENFFTAITGEPCQLVRHSLAFPRIHPSSRLGVDVPSKFTDGYPILVASQASLDLLNGTIREGGPVIPMKSFRPQIVLSGGKAHQEDRCDEIEIGESVRLKFVKECVRCSVPQVDPDTGVARKRGEPTRTLLTYRLVPGSKKDVTFGSNYIVLQGGTINVGDAVRIL